jgi:hypothetical protein
VLAERAGIPLAYTTGVDIERDPAVLHGATAVYTLGHDEYWTPQRRVAGIPGPGCRRQRGVQ